MRCVSAFAVALGTALAQSPEALMKEPATQAAFAAAERNEPGFLDEQARFCQIPAPPFKEEARGKEFVRLFTKLGLKNVRMDKAGNVLGVRPGRAPHPNLVLAAHLDTVFPEGTDVKVTRHGTGMKGPGISDDCRGLATMLAVIKALDDGHVETTGTITFVADTGEEGLGDLRGMKQLFGETLRDAVDSFISIDGPGTGITNIGVGSLRYRVSFKGPGGHSYGAFGMANPIQAMGRAMAKIDDFEVPANPKTTFNVGRVGGGTSVNAIPFEAWMEVDMRSADKTALKALDEKFKAALMEAVADENKRWKNRGAVSVAPELVGIRPAGETAQASPLVQTALAVSKAMGMTEVLREGSTDSNVPMNMGIPAITIGGGGQGSGAHSLGETFDSKDSVQGVKRALLLAVALTR